MVDARGADAPSPDARTHTGTAKSHTLFVNTEGVTLTPGADDAAVMAEFGSILAPYDVAIVNARPAAGPYDMVVVTDSSSQQVLGNAGIGANTPTSCNNTASVISGAGTCGVTDATMDEAARFLAAFGPH